MNPKILIITSHYPPSNLAGVHRSRLFAQHLPALGWTPIILTVDEKYYEEKLDWDLYSLVPSNQQVEKVKAFPITKPRLIGDIGLRAFFQLRRKALTLIRKENIQFVYILIPSFYLALLGPYLFRKTGVKFGIDYIDPWVHRFPGSDKKFSRHWWSTKIATYLEPKAIAKASLITGVAEGYYKGVQERNQNLLRTCLFGAMPYGGEKADHEKIKELRSKPYLFPGKADKLQLVYAGAMLPKAYQPLTEIFRSISQNLPLFEKVEFHFIGTGKSPNDRDGYNIKPLAEKFGLWQTMVFEYPARIPYLDVLIHLEASDGIFILGSTEPHYTPSKLYQAVLSAKPILAVLHENSPAYHLLLKTKSGVAIGINEQNINELVVKFADGFRRYKTCQKSFYNDPSNADGFQAYSALEVTKELVALLNRLV